MAHGDDSGLRFPPHVAPTQVVVVPISVGDWRETVLPVARAAAEMLRKAGLRVEVDAREEYTPGWKFAEHEMRGVPLRVEIGPRDVKAGQAVLVRRDLRTKEIAALPDLPARVPALLEEIQACLFGEAKRFLDEHVRDVRTFEQFKDILENKRGFVRALWCGSEVCEERIKNETMATIRVLPFEDDGKPIDGGCVCCGGPALTLAHFARAY